MSNCIFCGEKIYYKGHDVSKFVNGTCCNHCYIRIIQPYESDQANDCPTRVKLFHMEGEPQMPKDLLGTVTSFDDIGQIHVKWDNGSTLALNAKVDVFAIL